MKEYLFWDDEILIESINADIICLYVFKGKEVEKRMINNIAKEIILRINGMHTFDDIVKYFSQKYETSIEEVEGKLVLFFASTFWRKMQNIFGECCISKLEKVARPRLAAILPAT